MHAEGTPGNNYFAPKNTFVEHQSMPVTAEISLYPALQVNFSRACMHLGISLATAFIPLITRTNYPVRVLMYKLCGEDYVVERC